MGTRVPRGILELTVSVVSKQCEDDTDGEYYEFTMNLDKNAGNVMTSLLENNAVSEIANYTVKYVELNNVEYRPDSECADSETSGGIEAGEIVTLIAIGALIAGLGIGISLFALLRCGGYRFTKGH